MPLQVDQLRWMAATVGAEVAYVDVATGASIPFSDWEAESNRLARGLVGAGLAKGELVALHLENQHVLRWIVVYAAIHKAGAVAVPTNVRLTDRELTTVLSHAEPAAAVTSTALSPTVASACGGADRLRILLCADDPEQWSALLHADSDRFQIPVTDEDLADVLYTSGTTGLPKGIAVRHRDTHLVPNGTPPWTGRSWLHASPLSTFAGITFVYNPMKMGMRGLYLPRFDVDNWIDAVEEHRPTMAFLVPAMVQLLLDSPRFASADLTSLTVVSIGSAPLAPTLHEAMTDRLPDAMITNNYSMTESGSAFTHLPRGELRRRRGSVGRPLPPTEIRIADDRDAPVAPGEVGEVLFKVGEHHREYYKDPDATAQAWTGEWLRSGDLGRVDEDGFLYIVGRQKDLIIRGGNNIAPAEIENVLYEHPGVLEAAVVGLPHEVLGEDVGAAVVLRPGATAEVDAAVLRAFCSERLADYKVPRRIWFVDALPRNATGKVVKRDITPC